MRRTLAKLWRESGGAAAIEFAIVIPPLLILIYGVFEFGRLLWTREAMQETAAVGARCMAMGSTSCAASGSYSSSNTQTYIEGIAANWNLTLTNADLTLNNNTTCAGVTATNGFSTVTINYTFQSIVPNVVKALNGGKALSVTACFPNNQ